MSTMKRFEMKAIHQVLSIVLVISIVANADDGSFYDSFVDRRALIQAPSGAPSGAPAATGPGGVIDISKSAGAKGDGQSDMTTIIQKAWTDACNSKSAATLLIPKGQWLTAALNFQGPCTAPPPITIQIEGTLMAKPDCKSFPEGVWINLYQVSSKIMGGGVLDGQGAEAWKTKKQGDGKYLPDSLVYSNCQDSSVENINILNSKGFNMKVADVQGFKADKLNISCAWDSLNTDGIHVGRVSKVTITNSVISVGDDCISIGDDSRDVTISNITCGPGHGISIGSLGRNQDEKDVQNIDISNCRFINTTNGARIKTFRDSPALNANNISFTDITVENVYNPIIIDQNYASESKPGPSKVKITGVNFKNIKGTSLSNVAISLNCSQAAPCEGIQLTDIDFTYTGNNTVDQTLSTACANAKASFQGKINPKGC